MDVPPEPGKWRSLLEVIPLPHRGGRGEGAQRRHGRPAAWGRPGGYPPGFTRRTIPCTRPVQTASAPARALAVRRARFLPCQGRSFAARRWAARRSLQAGAHPPGRPDGDGPRPSGLTAPARPLVAARSAGPWGRCPRRSAIRSFRSRGRRERSESNRRLRARARRSVPRGRARDRPADARHHPDSTSPGGRWERPGRSLDGDPRAWEQVRR
jgi:hypothetical protein